MKLNVLERLTLIRIIPAPEKGSFLTHKIFYDLVNALSLSEEEFEEFGIKQVGEQITWNVAGNIGREIKIGKKAMELIVKPLKELIETLDKENNIEQVHVGLHEKFIENKSK